MREHLEKIFEAALTPLCCPISSASAAEFIYARHTFFTIDVRTPDALRGTLRKVSQSY
jgi:hypothetical protein